MTPDQWDRTKELFDQALDLPAPERRPFVERNAADDAEVCAEVIRLLDSDSTASRFLETPLVKAEDWLPSDFSDKPTFAKGDLVARRFEIVEFLGKGGMGEVYEAVDTKLRDKVALKTIRAELADDQPVRRQFLREVSRSRRVTHANVVRIYDLFEHGFEKGGSVPLMTMELLRGKTLSAELKERGRIELEQVLPVARQLCLGLAAAHEAGLVHRDLKPGNVILVEENGATRAVITDFGLAKVRAGVSAASTRMTTAIAGTPAYMAPELFDEQPASVASDIYALGSVLYEMVTGRQPIEAATPLSMVARRVKQDPRPASDLVAGLPSYWSNTIAWCLMRHPQDRPVSALQVLSSLEGKESLRSFRVRARRQLVRRRNWLAAAGAAAGAFAVSRYWIGNGRPAPGPKTVLLAEWQAAADLDELAQSVRQLLLIALSQSPEVLVLPESRVAESLAFTRLPRETRIAGSVAREIAHREGVAFLMEGSLARTATAIAVRIEVVEGRSGRVVGTVDDTVAGEEMARAADRLAVRLRTLLGERAEYVGQSSVPLERATTSSVEALQQFTRALALYNRGNVDGALVLLQSALKRDPEFALAHEYLAFVYDSRRETDAGLPHAERAFALREQTTERERYMIEAVYHSLRGDWEKSLQSYRALVALFPNDGQLQRQIAHKYVLTRKFEDAVRSARTAVQFDGGSVVNRVALALALCEAGRADDALKEVIRARDSGLDAPTLAWPEGVAHLARGEVEAARAAFERFQQDESQPTVARAYLAKCLVIEGKLGDAVELLEADLAADVRRGDRPNEALRRAWLSELYIVLDQLAAAGPHVAALAAFTPTTGSLGALRLASVLGARCGNMDAAAKARAALKQLVARYPSTRADGMLAHAESEFAHRAGRAAEAHRLIKAARALWDDAPALCSEARIEFEARNWTSCIEACAGIREIAGTLIRWELPLDWVVCNFWSAECERNLGNLAQARDFYQRFLYYWGTGNPQMRAVKTSHDALRGIAVEGAKK